MDKSMLNKPESIQDEIMRLRKEYLVALKNDYGVTLAADQTNDIFGNQAVILTLAHIIRGNKVHYS